MKFRLLVLLVFVAIPAVAAVPGTFVSCCDVRMEIRDGRNPEGSRIPEQQAKFILPCITKKEFARIIEDYAKGNGTEKDRALEAVRRAQEIKLMLTTELAAKAID